MQDMSYLDRVVSGEGQNRLNKHLRVKWVGFDDLNCNIACCAVIWHKDFWSKENTTCCKQLIYSHQTTQRA
jgi:hypothetical protein